jgi:hypothetical protein
VPCGKSMRCTVVLSPFRFYKGEHSASLVEVQGQRESTSVSVSGLSKYGSNPRDLSAIRHMVQKRCSEKYAWGHSTYEALIEKLNCEFVVRAVALRSKGVQASSRGSGIARPTAKW